MIFTNYPITLDVHSILSQVSIPVPQNDTARRLSITLTEEGKPYFIPDGCRAAFTGTKADGTILYNDCIIENNAVIRYDFTEQTSAAVGKADCQVKLYGVNGRLLTSPRLTLVVYENAVGDVVLSEDEKNVIDSIKLNDVVQDAAIADAQANIGKNASDIGGIKQTLKELGYAEPTTHIDLSEFESAGKIVETFADGSTQTTTMEFDELRNPVRITDGNGNETVLKW